MTENLSEETQQFAQSGEQAVDGTTRSVANQPATAFFQYLSDRKVLLVICLCILGIFGVGYLFFQSNQPNQTHDEAIEISATPTEPSPSTLIVSTTPTITSASSLESTTVPLATKQPATPTPSPIIGVDMRFSDVHFYPEPEPNTTFTPFRVANGGSITVPNEENVSEFKLFALFVNHGDEESKNVWVHYFVDGVEVNKGIAYLPGNMAADNLVTRDSAQPVQIPASGTHTIRIVIDQENQSNDVDLSNNTYTFTYTAQ